MSRGMAGLCRCTMPVFFIKSAVMMMTAAAIRRCREDRENRSQCRCGIGSLFHNADVSDDSRAKSIGGQPTGEGE
jgi:hypothetical protein